MAEEEKKKEETAENEKDVKKRSIFLSGMVNEAMTKTTVENLIKLEKESPLEDIVMYIDSYGGYLDSLFAIIDVMDYVYCDVQTVCIGKAMSAAAVILANGAKGKRFITPHAKTMIHQLFAHAIGPADDIAVEAEDIRKDQKRYEELVVDLTGQTLTKIQKDMKATKYMNAEESVKYGLVDAIKKKKMGV
jgi:ATP-dependent Clp protease protease subunit